MGRSSADIKNLGGRPRTGIGTPVMVRLQSEQLAALDAWIAARDEPRPSRPEAIRIILQEKLDV
jgi:cytochrome c553